MSKTKIDTILSDQEFMEFFKGLIEEAKETIKTESVISISVIDIIKIFLLEKESEQLKKISDSYRKNLHALFIYNDVVNRSGKETIQKLENTVDVILEHIGFEKLEQLNTMIYQIKIEDSYSFYKNIFETIKKSEGTNNIQDLLDKIDILAPLIEKGLSVDRFFQFIRATHITIEHISLLGETIIICDNQLLQAILFGSYHESTKHGDLYMSNYPQGPIDHIKILGDDIYNISGSHILNIYHYTSPKTLKIIQDSPYRHSIYGYKEKRNSSKNLEKGIGNIIFVPSTILQQYINDLNTHGNIDQFFADIKKYIETHQGKILSDWDLYHIQRNFSHQRKNIGRLDEDTLKSLKYIGEKNSFSLQAIAKGEKGDSLPLIECLTSDNVKNLLEGEKNVYDVFTHVVTVGLKNLDKLTQEEFAEINSGPGTKNEKIAQLYKIKPPKQINTKSSKSALMQCFKNLSLEQLYAIKTNNLIKITDTLGHVGGLSIDEIQNIGSENIGKISRKDLRLKLFSRIDNS